MGSISKTAVSNANFQFQGWIAGIGIFLFLAKLLAWQLTHSDAIFSDAMESIVNIIAAFMGLYSLYLASKPKDDDHPYGHGKVEFVTSGIEGAMIIFAGVLIGVEAVGSLVHGNNIQKIDWGIGIVFATAVLNYVLGYFSYHKGLKENSLVLQASGKHLQSDTWTTVGVVLSLIIVHFTRWQWLDAVVSIVFGWYIIFVGYKIIRKSLSGIMDEADASLLEEISQILIQYRKATWIDVHNVKIQQYGSKLHIDGHVTLPYYYSLKDAHAQMEELIVTIAHHLDRAVEFNFHMDDCKPFSCEICLMENCPKREKTFVQKVEWSPERIAQSDKHRSNELVK